MVPTSSIDSVQVNSRISHMLCYALSVVLSSIHSGFNNCLFTSLKWDHVIVTGPGDSVVDLVVALT